MRLTRNRPAAIKLHRAPAAATQTGVVVFNESWTTTLSFLPTPPSARRESENVVVDTEAQLEALLNFLLWKDPEHAETLISMFALEDIARALREKYKFVADFALSPSIPRKVTLSDMKIDEILDSEERFVNTIIEVQDKYIDALFTVYASNDERAIQALGLTQVEANQIFENLAHIRQFSQALLHKLACINLVRTQPISGEGRAVHVGRAFVEMAPKLHVYAPAVIGYSQSIALLEEATARVTANRRTSNNGTTFLSLWANATADPNTPLLYRKQLSSVLITPMQRLPRYEMLLQALAKDCDHADALPVVLQALNLVSSAVAKIDESMKRHDKLSRMFGTKVGLNSVSTGGIKKHGDTIKVVNGYKSKNMPNKPGAEHPLAAPGAAKHHEEAPPVAQQQQSQEPTHSKHVNTKPTPATQQPRHSGSH